jgi:uncharacterized protein
MHYLDSKINAQTERSALSSFLLIIGLFLVNLFLFSSIVQAIIVVIVMVIEKIPLDVNNLAGNLMSTLTKSETGWWGMMVAQGFSSLIAFIFTTWIYWIIIEKKKWADLNFKPLLGINVLFLVILIQFASMPLAGEVISWNEKMQLPEFLKGVEEFMREMEDQMADLTKYLVNFNTIPKFIVGFLVIAVIAGIGEELIFRGLIQRKIYLGTGNIHLAIWVSAFIFSAIHFQFYGFLPRMLLGALFGYLYFWSGNILVPIFGHILNNGLALIAATLVSTKTISSEIEKMDTLPLPVVIASVLLTAGGLWYFKKIHDTTPTYKNT